MEDAVHAVEIEIGGGQVELAHVESCRVLALQLGVVVLREAVDTADVVSLCDKTFCEMRADEPGRAGDDECAHVSLSNVPSGCSTRQMSE